MQALNYIILITGMFFLYWCTSSAYYRVVHVTPLENLPIFHRQNCIITHLEIKDDDKSLEDLSIYYSGTNLSPPTVQLQKEEAPDNKSIMDIIKSRGNSNQNEAKQSPTKQQTSKPVDGKKVASTTKKVDEAKIPPKKPEDDAFKPNKQDNSKKQSPSNKAPSHSTGSVFDVLE